MSDDNWQPARLIPVSAMSSVISGVDAAVDVRQRDERERGERERDERERDEQGRRVMSALLAVMGAVREFGRAVIQPMGAPTGELATYLDVPFVSSTSSGCTVSSDCTVGGVIQVNHGHSTWTALVEVKTGNSYLNVTRVETYLDLAWEQGFDAVLTISNELPFAAGEHPIDVDPRKLREVTLHHYAWSHLLAEAVVQKEYRGIADPDQAWVLGELIRYLEHPRSGTLLSAVPSVVDLTVTMEPTATSASRSVLVDSALVDSGLVDPVAAERARTAPMHPSRREMRLSRPLETGTTGSGAGAKASAAPEAGWYQDPGNDQLLRWYDGSAWSDRTYPAQAALA